MHTDPSRYDLLLKHLGARIGLTAVLHTWGSSLTHHPHAHVIVLGGGFSIDGQRWIACRPGFFCPCGCSRASSAACSWKGWPPPTKPGGCVEACRTPAPCTPSRMRMAGVRKP